MGSSLVGSSGIWKVLLLTFISTVVLEAMAFDIVLMMINITYVMILIPTLNDINSN